MKPIEFLNYLYNIAVTHKLTWTVDTRFFYKFETTAVIPIDSDEGYGCLASRYYTVIIRPFRNVIVVKSNVLYVTETLHLGFNPPSGRKEMVIELDKNDKELMEVKERLIKYVVSLYPLLGEEKSMDIMTDAFARSFNKKD